MVYDSTPLGSVSRRYNPIQKGNRCLFHIRVNVTLSDLLLYFPNYFLPFESLFKILQALLILSVPCDSGNRVCGSYIATNDEIPWFMTARHWILFLGSIIQSKNVTCLFHIWVSVTLSDLLLYFPNYFLLFESLIKILQALLIFSLCTESSTILTAPLFFCGFNSI